MAEGLYSAPSIAAASVPTPPSPLFTLFFDASNSNIPSIKANTTGTVTALGGLTTANVQTVVTAMATDTATIDFTISGGGTVLTADVILTAIVLNSIAAGDTTHAPSRDAVNTALAGKQPLDTDLTTIAGLTATTGNIIQSVASAWSSVTPATFKTSLSLVKGDVGLGNVDNTSDVNKPVSTLQAAADALNLKIASNLSDLANAGTARTNLGLGSAATQPSSAFDAAGAAAAAQAASQPLDSDLTSIAALATSVYGRSQLTLASATADTAQLDVATNLLKGLMPNTHAQWVAGALASSIVFAVNNAYSNLVANGVTDDTAAFNTLLANVPNRSIIILPCGGSTIRITGAITPPGGKNLIYMGGSQPSECNILQTSLTADHFTVGDWYNTFQGISFTTNHTTCTTNGQALTSGTVINIAAINTALVPASGTINIGSTIGWQALTYSAITATTVTLSSTGAGTTVNTGGVVGPVVFKSAGAAINAGNLVGINATDNFFDHCYNGYTCSGSTSNSSEIFSNQFLNTINLGIQIDGANWNGLIHKNVADCTTASRTLSHLELLQVGSAVVEGNQLIRGQFNCRAGSTTVAYPAGVFGVYFSDNFFDNAGTDCFRFQGISAIQRIKFSQCWFSSAAVNGINFTSTASTLPTDIEFTSCNIYANAGAGITGAGVQDYKFNGGEIAGNANGVAMVAAAAYSCEFIGTRIGPTGGFGANATGINIGGGTYTKIKFKDCDTRGNTTALTLGTVTVTNFDRFSIIDCPGINPRGSVTTPAVPATTVTATNTTGFRIMVYVKWGATAPTAISINGVALTVLPGINTLNTFVLDPGGTFVYTGTSPAGWTWVGM